MDKKPTILDAMNISIELQPTIDALVEAELQMKQIAKTIRDNKGEPTLTKLYEDRADVIVALLKQMEPTVKALRNAA